MGMTAENVAERFGISRQAQDEFALSSHAKAVEAARSGWFAAELTPVATGVGKRAVVVEADEGPRADASVDALARLAPAFLAGGSVTAGNSSTLNDGAAALLVTSAERAATLGLPVRARVRACASAGVDPRVMGIGPVPATQLALSRAGLAVGDIDVWEINEAFAAQSLAVIGQLGIDAGRVNLHGGAVALGHPLGCSGARILVTLLNVMERIDAKLGAATLCVGVGQGLTVIVER
jgi:acetyl-CoA C-acetyltransferase